MRLRLYIPASLAGAVLLPELGLAHEGATGIVKTRMDAMESMGKSLKEISRRLRANQNLAGIEGEASHIRETAAHITALFPPGGDTKPTDALPAIWRRWPEFQAKAAQLEAESARLAAVAATGDPKAIAAQFKAVGQSCAGCHHDFRAKQ